MENVKTVSVEELIKMIKEAGWAPIPENVKSTEMKLILYSMEYLKKFWELS